MMESEWYVWCWIQFYPQEFSVSNSIASVEKYERNGYSVVTYERNGYSVVTFLLWYYFAFFILYRAAFSLCDFGTCVD